MKITKASAAEVLSKLSPMAVKILRAMHVDKVSIDLGRARQIGTTNALAEYHNAIIELIARNILRADYDIIHGNFVTVLQPGGRFIVKLLESQNCAQGKDVVTRGSC